MGWLRTAGRPPRSIFMTDSEPVVADALRHRIEEELGWTARVPDYRDTADID
jgi:metallo-beta-lactamase family protein